MNGLGRIGRAITASVVVAASLIAATSAVVSVGATTSRRVVYLTFDDGPALDSATASLLDLLDQHGVTATFFVVGDNVDRDPAMIRRILGNGHALGSHSDAHRPLDAMSTSEIRTEFLDAQAAVDRAGGDSMTCYRPPFGATNDTVRAVGASLGMSEELWDLDIHDYERTDAVAYADALEQVGDGEVVLLHDGYLDGEMTVEAVRLFLAEVGDTIEFRALPGCLQGSPPPPTTTTTRPTTTSTSTTTTTRPTTTSTSTTTTTRPTTTSSSMTTTTRPTTTTTTESILVVTGDVVVPPPPPCLSGPLGPNIDLADPMQGAVFRIYCSHLGREPDREGFLYWLGIARAEASLHPLSYSFLNSAEYEATYGVTDDPAFLGVVYANVLGRAPDDAGRAYWLTLLSANLPRREVMLAFSESGELKTSTGTS